MGPIFVGLVIPWFRAYFIGVTPELLVGIIIPKKLEKASGYRGPTFKVVVRRFKLFSQIFEISFVVGDRVLLQMGF